MNWLKFARLLLQIVLIIVENRRNRELIQAGKAEAENEALKLQLERFEKALNAANRIEPVVDLDGLSDDPHNRD
ncbi:hypothetical protein [uncultured Cohaesibacter sp.]|uniref:hypothetical protein n=1 Tax=uncultured Cohaesibacter sp. TaxID=1002546 RepID=UPI00292EED3D|nr:hypothetical protein [uncultured Cohaesibacter sp.]